MRLPRPEGALSRAGIAAIYLAVALWLTHEAWLSGRLVGGGDSPDWSGTLWAFWWTGFAVAHGESPFSGGWDFFPVGQDPVAQYNLLDAALAAPLIEVFGAVAGYNAFATLAIATAAIGAHALARVAGASRGAALVAGLALEVSPFLCYEVQQGRLSQALLLPWLLGLAGLERLARGEGTWRLAVGTGLLVAASSLVYWYYGLFLVIAAVPLWLARWRSWDRARLGRLGLAAGVAAAACAPFVLALALRFEGLPGVARAAEGWMHYGRYGRGEFGLSMAIRQSQWPGWPLAHVPTAPVDQRLPAALLGLGLLGLLWRPRGRLRWFAVAAVGYTLTLGPYIKWIDGAPRPYKLPYLWLYDNLAYFDRLWWPGRFGVLIYAGLGVLAALHLDALARRLPRGRTAALGLGAALALADVGQRNAYAPIVADPLIPYDEALYAQLDGALVTTPVLGEDTASRYLLWFQVFHELPVLTGLGAHLSGHRPPGYEAYIEANGLLRALAAISGGDGLQVEVTPADVEALLDDGFRWVVVDPGAFSRAPQDRPRFSQAISRLWGEPDVAGDAARAWRIQPLNEPVVLEFSPVPEPSGPRRWRDPVPPR